MDADPFFFLQIYEAACIEGYRNFNSGVCNPSRILGNYASNNGKYHFFKLQVFIGVIFYGFYDNFGKIN